MPIQGKISIAALLLWCCAGAYAAAFQPQESLRESIELDTGWLYNKADNASFSGGTGFNDNNWTKVCLPHANVVTPHAYMDTSSYKIISWYRRHFNPPATLSNRRFILEFQGVAVIATVYVNGVAVGTPHKGAYTPFTIDVTGKVRCGQDNVIAVKVDARRHAEIPPEGRPNLDFMVFGGIVRPVTMIIADPLHVEWTFVATQNPLQAAPVQPVVNAQVKVVNNSGVPKSCTVLTSIVDKEKNVVATASSPVSVPASGSVTVKQTTGAIAQPQLWTLERPALYDVYTQLLDGSACIDEYQTRMGIRSLTMSKTDGHCYLNGKALKLRGLNRHETYPYIGRAAPKRLQRRDADILKYELGCNIVRTAHYPQAPDFLDRCDEIGLLVLEEIPGWQYLGTGEWRDIAKQNLVDMVLRDRNHPSLFSWGCRVNESPDDTWYESMNDTARSLDPTRLTHGVRYSNGIDPAYFYEDLWTRNFVFPHENPQPIPFITTEYAGHTVLKQAHAWDDDRTLMGQFLDETYGHARGQNASYQYSRWGGLIGWCAFDYNSPHRNATNSDTGRNYMGYVSPHGVSSIFRLPKFAGYFYQSQRDPSLYGPMVFICNHWTPSSPTRVVVVSNCDEVALYKNGTLVERKKPDQYTSLPHPCYQWIGVTFEPGELKAVGYIGGAEAATHIVHPPGKPAALKMAPDTSVIYTGGDMTSVIVSLVDEYGQVMHYRADSVELSAGGAGEFIGESRTALEGGQMVFYVKTGASETGNISCQARCAGFSASATVKVEKKNQPTALLSGSTIGNSTASLQTQPGYYRVSGSRFFLPCERGKKVSLSLFDCRGRLVRSMPYSGVSLDLNKIGIAQGVHIVRIRSMKN